MADNSKRERIIVYVVDLLETLASINTVVRVKQTYQELENFSGPQMPVAAVVGRLPVPSTSGMQTHISRRTSVDIIISDLAIDVFVYGQDNVAPDTLVSNLADDLWALLYQDQKMGGLVVETRLILDEENEFWHPYVAFKLTVQVKYKHDTGGI
jgi:hypothetical protein